MAIRVGVQLQPQHTSYQDFAAAVTACEGAGVDTLWTWDHFYPLYGSGDGGDAFNEAPPSPSPLRGAHFEGWTLLAAMACLTRRAEVGLLVGCNSYRNPELVADMARTIDHISGGRAILGLGSGWFEKDYLRYGYEFGTAPSRLRDLGANLPRVEARLAALNPPPIRSPLPIMIGGGGERVTLKLVARHAHMWNGFGPPESFARKNAILDGWCREVGRDPAEIERTVLINSQSLEAPVLEAFVEAGATHLILGMDWPYPLERVERLLAWRRARGGAGA